jgi:hypothetical protein
MTWIRGPLWDGVWILSGPVVGVAMLFAPFPVMMGLFVVFNSAHLIMPLAVAWGSRSFRQIMVERWVKFILVPACIMLAAMLSGVFVDKVYEINPATLGVRVYHWSDYRQPFVIMLVIYFFWNAYHFGMQHFGVIQIYRRKHRGADVVGQRRVAMTLCLVLTTLLGMILLPRILMPFAEMRGYLSPWALHQESLFMLGFLIFNHSLTAIGISSHVMANQHGRSPWLFVALLLIVGAIVFWLLFYAPGLSMRITVTAVALRAGLGFVHFLYDRWVYKLSDPAVRASIGLAFAVVKQSPQLFRSEERAHA